MSIICQIIKKIPPIVDRQAVAMLRRGIRLFKRGTLIKARESRVNTPPALKLARNDPDRG